jgi:hypothetical protein
MEEKISNIIPTLYAEIESDEENESEALLGYYRECNANEKAVVDKVMMYICGWTFETILAKCGIKLDEAGEPVIDLLSEAEESELK